MNFTRRKKRAGDGMERKKERKESGTEQKYKCENHTRK
jgi:hypothetical protein